MKEIQNPKILQKQMTALRRRGKTIGFVPTMGALHEGHLSLVRAARSENKIVVVSIFVNPTQFGPKEDFRKYPQTIGTDRQLLKAAKVDYLFSPNEKAMYPEGSTTSVEVDGSAESRLTKVLCGKFRPGHFRGVATVVAKLFNLVQPDRAYFGAKDYQQSAVILKVIQDLDFDIDLKVLPTVREKDGLAMSSRNRYLAPPERQRALALSQTLFWLRGQIKKRRRDLPGLLREARRQLKKKVDRIDYLEVVDPITLQNLKRFQGQMVALAACFVGKTRLIDNVIIRQSYQPSEAES